VTGVTIVAGPAIYGKNLELLKEILPKGARIAILFNPDSPINARFLNVIQEAARTTRPFSRPESAESTTSSPRLPG
jgi:hypothetical protein